MPALSTSEVEEFLATRGVLMRIATVDGDGNPHVTPIWFVHEERRSDDKVECNFRVVEKTAARRSRSVRTGFHTGGDHRFVVGRCGVGRLANIGSPRSSASALASTRWVAQ